MPSPQNQSQDAILYIQGLSVQPLEQTALRIASAFDACSVSAAAEFMVSAGQDEEYDKTKASHLKTKVHTIQRNNPDGSTTNMIDLYEFEYLRTLTQSQTEGNLIVKTLRLAIQLIVNCPRLVGAFLSRKSQKTLMDRLQFVYASLIMVLLVVYLVILVTAVFGTVTQVIAAVHPTGSQPPAATAPSRSGAAASSPDTSPDNGAPAQLASGSLVATTALSSGSGLANAVEFWTALIGRLAPPLVILIAVLEAFYPNLKQQMLDAAVQYDSALEYLSFGSRGSALDGQLIALLDHIEAKGYQNLHVIAYSFGSILALDCFFPANQMPAERVKGIGKLVTVGCPFDLIRVFWPQYYADRQSPDNLSDHWINIYSPIDIFGSNFRNDAELLPPEKDTAFRLSGSASKLLCPAQNIVWTSGRSKKGLTTLELLALVGLEAHESYWGNQYESESTAFTMIVSELYAGTEFLA
jgi:hypothetical protein